MVLPFFCSLRISSESRDSPGVSGGARWSAHRNWEDWTQAPGQVTWSQYQELLLCDQRRPVSIPHLSCGLERETDPGQTPGTWAVTTLIQLWLEASSELPSMAQELPNWARPLCHHPSENVNMIITRIVTPSVTRETALSHNNYLFRK